MRAIREIRYSSHFELKEKMGGCTGIDTYTDDTDTVAPGVVSHSFLFFPSGILYKSDGFFTAHHIFIAFNLLSTVHSSIISLPFFPLSPHFVRAVKKLPRHIADHCEEREEIFRKNCFDPRLKTHKLHGRFYEHWSFSITHAYRIVFRFLTPDTVLFVDTDDHSIYQ